VYCVWQVVITPTVIFNNPVYYEDDAGWHGFGFCQKLSAKVWAWMGGKRDLLVNFSIAGRVLTFIPLGWVTFYYQQLMQSFPSSSNRGWWEVFETKLPCMILKIKDNYFTSASNQILEYSNIWQHFAVTRCYLAVWTQPNKRTATSVYKTWLL